MKTLAEKYFRAGPKPIETFRSNRPGASRDTRNLAGSHSRLGEAMGLSLASLSETAETVAACASCARYLGIFWYNTTMKDIRARYLGIFWYNTAMKDIRAKKGCVWRVVGAVILAMMAAVAFAVVALDGGVAEFTEAAVIPDDAEVAWLDGWEFTNGTASLMLSPSFSAARIFIGAEATDAPVAGTFAADGSGVDAVALAEESDGWYTNTLSVADPNIVEVGVALTGDDEELARVIALPIREVGNDDSSLLSIPPAGELMGEMPLGSGTPTVTAPALVSGLISEFYLASKNGGNYPGIPDFSLISPTFIKTDTTINFKSNGSWTGVPAAYKDYFASRHTGFIDIPADKTYTFYLQSDDGSMLYIDDELVVNNGGLHGLAEKSGSVYLAAGLHAIRIEYVESAGTAQLVLRWSATGINKAVVPASVFYSYPYAGTIPPSVWLRSPAAGAIYKHLEPITLTAEALDLDGSVTSVSFYDGDELLATLSSAPYEFVWTNQVPREVHALTALAVDADGNMRRTPPLEVTTVVRPAGLDFGADISFYSFSQNPTNLPDFSALTPFATGVVEQLSNPWTQAPWTSSTYSSYLRDRFGVVIEGYFYFREERFCAIRLSSDDGARLVVGGTILIDRDGFHSGDATLSPYVRFAPGLQHFRLEYFQSTGGKSLGLTFVDAASGGRSPTAVELLHIVDNDDSDGDGMPDWWESYFTLNPESPFDAHLDYDNDGLDNLVEYQLGTNPRSADSDGDGIPDGWEVSHGVDPLVADGAVDIDGDGLENLLEYRNGSDPLEPDTDADGFSDSVEYYETGTDPIVADSLSSGLPIASAQMSSTVAFSLPSANVCTVGISLAQEWHDFSTVKTALPSTDRIDLYVDGRFTASRTFSVVSNDMVEITFHTPVLAVGNHVASVSCVHLEHRLHDEVLSMTVSPCEGLDPRAVAGRGFFAPTGMVASCVSPIFVEGEARHPQLVASLTAPVRKCGSYNWFLDVPMLAPGTSAVEVVCESVVTAEVQVAWIPLDLFGGSAEIKVRGGSSLLVGGIPAGEDRGAVAVYTNGCMAVTLAEGFPAVLALPDSGVLDVAARWISDDGEVTVDAPPLSVICASGTFPGGRPACFLERRREWDAPDIPDDCVLVTDSHTTVERLGGGVLGLFADDTRGDRLVAARIADGGAVLDVAQILPLWAVDAYGNSCLLMETNEVGDVCRCVLAQHGADETVSFGFRMYTSSVSFDDYSSSRTLHAEDFSPEGFYSYDMVKPQSVASPCHYLYVYQDGVLLGEALYGKPALPKELR